MFRRLLPASAAVALFCVGCVPVTEPLGDVEKADPDKALVGKWAVANGRGTAGAAGVVSLTIEAREVKGNPKGLMRGMTDGDEGTFWFFTHAVGKHTYASVILDGVERKGPPAFDKEGGYEAWKKDAAKRYYVFRFARDGDSLTLDAGDNGTFVSLMEGAKIKGERDKLIEFYATPAGWLEKYLDKTGPTKLFNESNRLVFTRDKK